MNRAKSKILLVHGPAGEGASADECAAALNEQLGRLHALLKELVALADRKLAGIRAANTDVLYQCAAQEAELLARVFAMEQERKATLARLAHCLHEPQLERASLAQISERLSEPIASALRARNAALRTIAQKLQQKNRMTARVAQSLQTHIRAIFAEVAKVNQESLVYGPKGNQATPVLRTCIDAVG